MQEEPLCYKCINEYRCDWENNKNHDCEYFVKSTADCEIDKEEE